VKTAPPDLAPTLTDSEVLAFCRDGYMMLESVVPDEVNRRTLEFVDESLELEPSAILQEDWFRENVILNPRAAGAIRSLLGAEFHLPILMSNHRRNEKSEFPHDWHVDGNYQYDYTLRHLQVFYYPQDVTASMGPTEILPGSHFYRSQLRFMAQYDRIDSAVKTVAPAGSIFITIYEIWHRKGYSQRKQLRNLLKYFYWRTTPPVRDWIHEDDFDFSRADYEGPEKRFGEQFRACREAAKLFYWLCGMEDRFQILGGQSWPLPAYRLDVPYGYPGPHPG
jgi:hypothetical protein